MFVVEDVVEGLGSTLVAAAGREDVTFARAIIDSREVGPGDLFFALRGERHDAHDFILSAFQSGAAGAVVARPVEPAEGTAVFHVSDPLVALQKLASAWRARHATRVIGITGSVGKTTTKEVVASVLSRRYKTLRTKANLNTEIGVPLTLLNLRTEHERAVLELAMYVPGDIALLASISRPDVAVVTNVSPVHLERAGSFGRIIAGKAELVEALPSDGLAVLNGDDSNVTAMSRRTNARAILFGLSEQCDVRATNVVSRGLDGFSFGLAANGLTTEVTCPLPGKHHVYAALAAAAVALNEGMGVDEIGGALRDVTLDLRLTVRRGPNGSTIIDDSYNASPASMVAALDLLSETPGRHIAVLGHMRELGTAEAAGHTRVGRHAASTSGMLVVVGVEARLLADEAKAAGHPDVRWLATPAEAADLLQTELRAGDHCLIKASRAVGLEAVVEALVGGNELVTE